MTDNSAPIRVPVNSESPYDVIIGRGLLTELVEAVTGADSVAILYQPTLAETAEVIRKTLDENNFNAHRVEIPDAPPSPVRTMVTYTSDTPAPEMNCFTPLTT